MQENAERLDPQVRQFSELPEWVLQNTERLRNRRIMMYCTGGVRCETASAFVKSLGPEFQDVYQLRGETCKHLLQL